MEAWTVAGVKARCLRMRGTAQVRSLASEEEINTIWPGSALNPEKGLGAWIYCYGQMVSFLARRIVSPAEEQAALQARADMLRGAPMTLPIVCAIEGAPAEWRVYPKGFNALMTLAAMERQYRETLLYRRALEALENPAPQVEQALTLINRSLVLLTACFAWIVTTPGPGVPYENVFAMPWDGGAMPPAWCFDLDPHDVVNLTAAHVQVNLARLQCLPKLAPEDTGERGTGWATFFVSLADALHTSTDTLMGDQPLTALMARSVIAADMAQRADAERKRKAVPRGR